MNKVVLAGNLTRDPELRYLPSGQPVCSFSIAINRKYQNSSGGEAKEETTFLRIVAWARLAEICNEYLKKGSSVLVDGRLQSRSWEADGVTKSSVEVVAGSVQFLSQKESSSSKTKTDINSIISDDELKPDEDVPF